MFRKLAIIFKLPGLPPANTKDRRAFLAVFWPSFYCSIITGLSVGFVVGLVLLIYQYSLESRQARESYAREVSILRERLREAASIPDVFIISNAIASVPPQAEEVMKLLRELPISLWRDELSNEKPFLDLVHKFQVSYSKFRGNALQYDKVLRQFARRFNGARGAISANDGRIISYVLGTSQGFTPKTLAKWIGFGMKQIPPWLEEARSLAAADKTLSEAQEKYSTSRKELVIRLQELLAKLDA